MKKRLIICMSMLVLILTILLSTTIIKKDNKIDKVGNNKNIKEMEQLLNIESYKAKLTVNVKSNKNENNYIINQEVKYNEYQKETFESPEELKETEIFYENNILTIKNSKIGASKIYEGYKELTSNKLFFTDFLKEYKNATVENKEIKEDNEQIKLTVKNKENYTSQSTLYIDKTTMKPTSMEIKDKNQNIRVYILYNEIEFNI